MKIFYCFFISLFILSTVNFAQSNNTEFRSTWVITWEYISSSGTVEQKKQRIRNILDQHKRANMTSVLWQVRQAGTAYYNSSFEPWGSYAGGTYPGFDPLEYAIEEAHKRGLEIHAWFNVFASASLAQGAPAQKHPEWICRDQNGNPMTSNFALSPGLPAVRNYLVNVAMEVVNNYDIDGFHLDYVRWNEYTSSNKSSGDDDKESLLERELTDDEVEHLIENAAGRYLYDIDHPFSAGVPAGFTSWENWWRWSVTEFVKTLHDSIQTVKPWVRLSVAALGRYNWSGWAGYNIVYQDAALWFNEGYIEQIAGMHYHWTTGSGFYAMLTGSCPQCWSQFIQPGINAGRHYTVGPPSYILKDNNIWNNHPDIINTSRTVPWVDGFQFFSYGSWRDMDYWDEAGNSFFKRKTKVKNSKFILDTIPDAPSVSLNKIDSLNYQITVTPHPSATMNQWFAVYRSEDNNLNVDVDDIIEIKFENTSFTIMESFSGTQDYNGKYTYFATMFDRYWNESLISNSVSTDSIPSFAPVVASSIPAQGDTVSITTKLSFTFTKTMNTTGFPAAINIEPPVVMSNGSWTNNYKTVTYTFTSPLDFETNYTVTIDTSAKDINGKSIDGNGDGIPGDPFILTFRTIDLDNTGPVVIFSYPDSTTSNGLFDGEDIIRVMFDEQINPSTINFDNVIFKRNDNAIGRAVQVNQIGNSSMLNIKAGLTLQPSENYSLLLKKGITDIFGNQMDTDYEVNFTIANMVYLQTTMIDDFTDEGYWWQPQQSGSTTGIIDSGTYHGYSTIYSVTGTTPAKSAYINYQWNPSAGNKLLRNYLNSGPPRDINFDTTFILQVYIFGDGSGTLFRFALDEGDGTSWPNHEVSKWVKIDWYGWKLVEWVLSDPNSVGTWIGNGVLDLPLYRIDSFQLKDDIGSAPYGRIYLDNLRIVKKASPVVDVSENENIPDGYSLTQNYPNPFNPSTVISYQLPVNANVIVNLYSITGEKITSLVNEEKSAGYHSINIDATSLGLSSGVYLYRIIATDNSGTNFIDSKKMILMK